MESSTTFSYISRESGAECCNVTANEDPTDYVKWSGSAEANLEVSLVLPGWKYFFRVEKNYPVKFYVHAKVEAGPKVTVTPNASGSASGFTARGVDCEFCYEITGSGGVGAEACLGAWFDIIVRVFEEGHWYTINGSVRAELSGCGSTSLSGSGRYKDGPDCDNPGVSGVCWNFGGLDIRGTLAFEVIGYSLSVSKTVHLVDADSTCD